MIIKAPTLWVSNPKYLLDLSVFLAGSIEMGEAVNWQDSLGKRLEANDFLVINPRRDDWDASWTQSIENPEFHTQVSWELNSITEADWVVFHFEPGTQSPITLMELGYVAGAFPDKAIVHCPEGFWRKGNVDIVCERFGIYTVERLGDIPDLLSELAGLSWAA